ncbi:MobQ family relaxase [Desulfosporosinus sp.]|uniref:MobQ family relaxase n=1 Tax=Desulfosporosinus sp. TaxID=157907 RepID=UPI0023212208|nr:MobQ family relaxase [Desulfosporosinus sp.]MDA8223596.1 MobA/MobL family protein [Desulfitobacterium hafniense]
MAIYHLHAQIIGRSGGKSAVASSAYRAGEKIHDEHIGQTFDYTRKQGVDYTEILTPFNAPEWASDRGRLWNEVEKIEKSKNSQLSRELNIALPKELTRDQQIDLIRNFVKEQFVDKGMVADLAMHHLAGENPHAHVMLTVRPFNEDKTWGAKSKKEYILDKKDEKIRLKSGEFKSIKIDSTDWNKKETLEIWRKEWSEQTNKALEKAGVQDRIDHRSLKDQGIQREPQIHVGPHATAMEKRRIPTERGDQNRKIISLNEARERLRKDVGELNAEIKKYNAEVIQFKAQEKELPKQPVAPISEPTRPPVVQQPQPKPSMPVRKEDDNGAISIDGKKQISQVKEDVTQDKVQKKPFHEIKADYDQARTEWGRQQELVDRIESQLRSETYKLEKYKDVEKRIDEVEERLGSLSRFNPFNRSEIKDLEQRKESLIKVKQTDFGELTQKHFEQRITQLNKKMQIEKKKMPELTTRYKQTRGVLEQRLTEVKALDRQKDLSKSKDLLERYKAGEKLTTQETKLINSFSRELNIKKIPIKSMDMSWER